MQQNYDDNFLARWMAGELTKSELAEFQKSEDYADYAKILDTLDTASFSEPDVEANYAAFQVKIQNESKAEIIEETPTKAKRLVPRWIFAAAAACVLLFVGYTFMFQETIYTTEVAQQTEFKLPDDSEVQLNADSKVTFTAFNWESNRKLNLEGEAFFKVKKGETFTVTSNQGDVTVLGTQFSVNSRVDTYIVQCYEGKVKVQLKNSDTIILTKGKSISLQKGNLEKYDIYEEKPQWLLNESSFYKVNIKEVVAEMERQYGITITGKEHLKEIYFSGRFKHDNLISAARTVFVAMGIPYTITEGKTVEIRSH
ncbi:FecR family protein [uncultured Kordia sp.]|uniref:FecR family protein n=1 Tax=uncultured Kordia sp. TaxID=507699 RepID=UPI00261F528A|nr:FecR family protein [uncultured Kordia sp.]